MLERIKQNWNMFFSMALGNLIIAWLMLYIKDLNLSLIMFAIVGILIGISALYNQNKEQGQKLNKILINQKTIISYLSGKYDNLDMNDTLSQEELDELLKAK